MPKITMLKGLPASGKTTKAFDLVKDSGNSGRINRDDLRAMLFNSEWSEKREGIVVEVEKAIAKVLIQNDQNAIIDDTNLTQRHSDMWSGLARELNCRFEVDHIQEKLEECITRDAYREKRVGRYVIESMALFNGLIEFEHSPTAIFDMDGTLADASWRQHHVQKKPKDWKSFYDGVGGDEARDAVANWANSWAQNGGKIIIVSGRPYDKCGYATVRWLRNEGIIYNHLFMRRAGDKRPDTDVKREILHKILDKLPKEYISFAVDDRPSIVRMWREEGIKVYDVGEGKEF